MVAGPTVARAGPETLQQGDGAGFPPPVVDAAALAGRLAALGPRLPGSPAHAAAAELLLAEMAAAGLAAVRRLELPGEPPLANLTAVLPGRGGGEILLTAHYDTVAASPGAADDASGCAVALAAAADLARTPLRRSLRLLLFDGEERGLAGSRAWLAGLSAERRDAVLAAVNLEVLGWRGGAGPTLLTLPVERGGRRRLAPGWLVHAGLEGCRTVAERCAFLDPLQPLRAQLLLAAGQPRLAADSDAFLEQGIAALILTDAALTAPYPDLHGAGDRPARLDPELLARRAAVAAAVVRRLDALAGRPPDEDRYLVLAGRVWLRRDLYWPGFGLWALLVFRGHARRRRSGRVSWRGFAFRMLFLVATIAAPVLAAVLLFPAAVLALVPPVGRGARALWIALGLAPAAGLAGVLAAASATGIVSGYALGPGITALLAATLATYAAALWLDPPPGLGRRAAAPPPPGEPRSGR